VISPRPRAIAAGLALAALVALPAGRGRAADPFATAHPESVYQTAVRLMLHDRDLESLAWFRACLARVQNDFWELHFNYFAALRNAATADTVRLGVRAPLVRSSAERTAMLCEALRELDRAEALAPDADTRALILVHRARTMRLAGMGWDAWLAFRQASEAVSHRRVEEFLADDFTDLMRHPTRPPQPHEVGDR